MSALKLLRYNTGTDKSLFTEFANKFDAVIMNATIAAYSGSAMADLISIYKNTYIIDPQTYILQQNPVNLVSASSKNGGIKKSISKYLNELPKVFLDTLSNNQSISLEILEKNLDELVNKVGEFETNYINSFIDKKDYKKYIDFINTLQGNSSYEQIKPKILIAPYFMLKNNYDEGRLYK